MKVPTKLLPLLTVAFVVALVVMSPMNNSTLNRILRSIESNPPVLNFNVIDEDQIDRLARAFPAWTNQSWCIPEPFLPEDEFDFDEESEPTGFLYVRVPKTGSSTISGVALRIANHYGEPGKPCRVYYKHRQGSQYRHRKQPSFLLGSLREPSSRALSHVMFEFISRRNREPSDQNIINALRFHFGLQRDKNSRFGYQLEWLTKRLLTKFKEPKSPYAMTPAILEAFVKEVFEEYSFITVSERMDESLVALQLLLGLKAKDVINLSSKTAGGYYFDRKRDACIPTKKPQIPPLVTDFLQSTEWQADIAGDLLLHKVANRSLDLTIEKLGKKRFELELFKYREVMRQAHEKCESTAIFPCSADGTFHNKTNCYDHDYGCGYPCLDALLIEKYDVPEELIG